MVDEYHLKPGQIIYRTKKSWGVVSHVPYKVIAIEGGMVEMKSCHGHHLRTNILEPYVAKPTQAIVEPNDMFTLLLFATRYAMGRMTAAPSEVKALVVDHISSLTVPQMRQLAEEVEVEVIAHETGIRFIGMDFDAANWRGLAKRLRKQIGRREAPI